MLQKNTNAVEPHVLRKYTIIQKIGEGAYGHVWKVEQKATNQIYALKKIFDAFQHATDAQRTYREVMILKQINHPNIVKLHETLRAENNRDLYMVMQYMEADLHQVIMEGILKDVHCRYIIYQIAKTLKYLHSASLLHRDLKPSNILINSNCNVKICDFGLVRCVQNEDISQILTQGVATRWYRAPQVLLGGKNYSAPADIWSFGCVIYELLTAKPLFQGTSNLDQLQKIIQFTGFPTEQEINTIYSEVGKSMMKNLLKHKQKQPKDLFSNICPQLISLIKSTLQFNPAKRITIPQILNLPIFQPFRNPEEELISSHPIKTFIDDNHQQSVERYRSEVYGTKRYSLQRTKYQKQLPKQKSNGSLRSCKYKQNLSQIEIKQGQIDSKGKETMIKYIKSTGNLQKALLQKPNTTLTQKPQKIIVKQSFQQQKFQKFSYNSSSFTKAVTKTSLKPGITKQSSISYLNKKKIGENGQKNQS